MDWLPVVAAVRPHLARLEALQLAALVGSGPGFAPVSSAPGDHWRTAALAALVARRAEPGGDPRSSLPRFVAGYGLGGVWAAGPGAAVAVGLVDSWSEAVPRPGRRPPPRSASTRPRPGRRRRSCWRCRRTCPPAYGAPADTAGLVEVLADTRQLAHARAARAEDLGSCCRRADHHARRHRRHRASS